MDKWLLLLLPWFYFPQIYFLLHSFWQACFKRVYSPVAVNVLWLSYTTCSDRRLVVSFKMWDLGLLRLFPCVIVSASGRKKFWVYLFWVRKCSLASFEIYSVDSMTVLLLRVINCFKYCAVLFTMVDILMASGSVWGHFIFSSSSFEWGRKCFSGDTHRCLHEV